MREIKFRAWDKENQIFIYAELRPSMSDPFVAVGEYPENLKHTYPKELYWEEYTGLKDKNGVEVWEGE